MWESACGKIRAMKYSPRNSVKSGFTIVELVVVVVVIGILAAVTVVSYNGVTKRANESATAVTASDALRKISTYGVTNGNRAPASLADIGLTNKDGKEYQYTTSANGGYCVTVTQNNSASYVAKNYEYNSTSVTATNPVSGPCPGHSANGGATIIRNLVTNPSFETGNSGWGASNASYATSTAWKHTGNQSMRVVNSTTSDLGDLRTSTSTTTIPYGMQPGKTYTISARLYFVSAPTGNLSRAPGILFWQSLDGGGWQPNFGPKAPTTPGTYTVSHTVTLPSNTTGVLIGLGVASTTQYQNFYYDSVMVTEGSTVYTPADGLSPGWVWTGAANASASTGPAL